MSSPPKRNTDPNLRPFLADLEGLVDELKHRLPCCPNCEQWNGTSEVCNYVAPAIRPPATVIAFGCWAFAGTVPF